ncbi:MAG: hypothetical protein J0M10_16530 [Chitinophagales bacterium]|nr:hypothetical protein [Chitinophagales bacterium]
MDAFFAQVEQRDNPELKGKPVSVGGWEDSNAGIVMTASYEARKYGVSTGISVIDAKKICPMLISLPCNGPKYERTLLDVLTILKEYFPHDCVEQYSIDECFMEGSDIVRNFDEAKKLGEKVKKAIWDELGLFVSIGASYNKSYAKAASKLDKPNGFTPIEFGKPERILKLSAEIGHYIADAHVPLHASSNHNGQFTNQRGIHGFWESRVPELLAEKSWDFLIGNASYISNPGSFIWARVLESAAAVDTVLSMEKKLSARFRPDQKYAFEERNGTIIRQYSAAFSTKYNDLMKGMVERRMRQSIYAVASFWYTAWVNAGQPDLTTLTEREFTAAEQLEFEALNQSWKNSVIKGRDHDH